MPQGNLINSAPDTEAMGPCGTGVSAPDVAHDVMRVPTLIALVLAMASGGCHHQPDISTQVVADVRITTRDTQTLKATFDIPAALDVDCATLAQLGLYPERRELTLLFAPAELTHDAALNQLAVTVRS